MNNNVRQNGLCRRVLAACVLGAAVLPGVADDRHRPHIVLVMLDDMGFSDLGCYGGEVETPHIDSLAAAGVRFSALFAFLEHGAQLPEPGFAPDGLLPA